MPKANHITLAIALAVSIPAHAQTAFHPPSVPLVANNPFLSIWSPADRLTDTDTYHWTRHAHPLVSLIKIDGRVFRLMGTEPVEAPPFPQVSLKVTPTRSIYQFANEQVRVSLTFMTPALPNDLDALSRPLTYLTWQVRSIDRHPHQVQIYDSVSSLLAVNRETEPVQTQTGVAGPLTWLRTGTQAQPVLGSSGDDHRINWGFAYAAASTDQIKKGAAGGNRAMIADFLMGSDVGMARKPQTPQDVQPVVAFTFDLGNVGTEAVSRQVIVAYDEIYAIKYFGKKLRPYWRRNGATPEKMLQAAAKDYPALLAKCVEFDQELTADATKVGGAKYAQICALAYRQALAGCGLAADANKQPLFFTKENTSNGDIATVDVIFPMDPVLILLSPTLAKASLVSVLDYAASWHWKFPNAPHDLGTYPLVFGRDDGGEGMPVEESGNMLILCDAIAHAEGNPAFSAKWWPQLTQWAKYLEQYGLDPEDQLCTDDFMGHLAHNANLSIKAILGLAAYGDLCRMRGDTANAARYAAIAKTDAEHWAKVADAGGHSLLAFDKPGTWSQKYNLVWDRLLGLNVFPPEIAQREIAQYKSVMQRYGVPLDSRTKLTKSDWTVWSATLAENRTDFEALISPIYDYLNETTARSPFADSYITDDIHSDGMHARPVIGGVFIKLLSDRAIWKKWASRDKFKAGKWAPLPVPPKVTEVVPTSEKTPAIWRYTTAKPADDWTKVEFDASGWKEGQAGFGTEGTPGAVVRTTWDTPDIWLRREVKLPASKHPNLKFYVYHDEDVEIYVNGVLAASQDGFASSYVALDITPNGRVLLQPGAEVTLAVHCHQTEGGQGVDVGLADIVEE
jgi:hypothetical protein